MVMVLPGVERKPSFGERIGAGLGQGISQGVSGAIEQSSRQKLLSDIDGGSSKKNKFSEMIPKIEEKLGFKLTPEQQESISMQLQGNMGHQVQEEDPFAKAKKYAAIGEKDLSNIASEEAKAKIKERSASAQRHESIATKTLESVAERAESLPQREVALQNMQDAIESGDSGFFSFDNLAEMTGIEALRTPEGSGFKTAGKEFFLGSLKRAGARPNQWVEQQISDMLPKIGRSKEANLSVTEALKTEMDVEKKQIELTHELADEMERNFGYVRRDLSDQVRKRIKPYAEEKQKELQKSLMDIKDKYEPSNKEGYLMYDPLGNLRRVPKKEVPSAKKDGYRMYK